MDPSSRASHLYPAPAAGGKPKVNGWLAPLENGQIAERLSGSAIWAHLRQRSAARRSGAATTASVIDGRGLMPTPDDPRYNRCI